MRRLFAFLVTLLMVLQSSQGQEHPRLFFNKEDVPQLRKLFQESTIHRQALDQTKKLLDRSEQHGFGYRYPSAEADMQPSYAAAYGLLWLLEGDPAYAKKAQELVEAGFEGAPGDGRQWTMAYRLLGTAIAYDLCYDAWEPDFRLRVGIALRRMLRNIANEAGRHTKRGEQTADPLDPHRRFDFAGQQSDFSAKDPLRPTPLTFFAAAALAGLAVMDDPLGWPTTPTAEDVETIPPAKDYEPWIGVPTHGFEDDRMMPVWLVNGPFNCSMEDDPLKEIGGMAKARPEPGVIVHSDGVPIDFRRWIITRNDPDSGPEIYPRDDGRFWGPGTGGGYPPGIRLQRRWRESAGHQVRSKIVFYSVLKNDLQRLVQVRSNWGKQAVGVRMWLNGHEVRDGQLIRLLPGLYPVMCFAPAGAGYSYKAPRLKEVTPDELLAWEAERQQLDRLAQSELPDHLEKVEKLITSAEQELLPDDGWGMFRSQEAVIPWRLAAENSGRPLASPRPKGWLQTTLVALALLGSHESRTAHYRALQGYNWAAEQTRDQLAGVITANGPKIFRPHELVMLAGSLPPDLPKPATSDQTHFAFPYSGVRVSRSSPLKGAFTQVLRTAGFASGHMAVHEGSHAWFPPLEPTHSFEDWTSRNGLMIADLFPQEGGEVVIDEPIGENGRKIVIRVDAWKKGEPHEKGNKKTIKWKGEMPTPPIWTRTILFLPRGEGLNIVTVDDLKGSRGLQKVWQLSVPTARRRVSVDHETQQVRWKGKQGTPVSLVLAADSPLDLSLKPLGKSGSHSLLKVFWEKTSGPKELDLVKRTSKSALIDSTDPMLDEFMDNLDDDIKQSADDKANRQGDQRQLISVVAIGATTQPVEITPKENETTLTLGDRTIQVRADGTTLIDGQP